MTNQPTILQRVRVAARSFAALLADHAPKPTVTIYAGPAVITFAGPTPPVLSAPTTPAACSCQPGAATHTCLRYGSIQRR